ncbi:MAG: DUF1428 domain-containing protein [Brevundimonas sp.]
MTYVSGFVTPVKTSDKDAYLRCAEAAAPIFKEFGALSIMENWGVDIRDGKLTDFKMAVKAEPDETVVLSWIVWPDKATGDAAEKKMMEDPRFHEMEMPFDGRRMVVGGFETIFEA